MEVEKRDLDELSRRIIKLKSEIDAKENELERAREVFFVIATELHQPKQETHFFKSSTFGETEAEIRDYVSGIYRKHNIISITLDGDEWCVVLSIDPQYLPFEHLGVKKVITDGKPTWNKARMKEQDPDLHKKVVKKVVVEEIDEDALIQVLSTEAHRLEPYMVNPKPTQKLDLDQSIRPRGRKKK